MSILTNKTKSEETDRFKSKHSKSPEKLPPEPAIQSSSVFGFPIQRKAACVCGGGCPKCQAKSANLAISQPTDASEIEADAMADKVMRMEIPESMNLSSSKNKISRKEDEEDDEEKEKILHRKTGNSGATSFAPAIVRDVLSSGGKLLDAGTRAFMEPRFNYDFGSVKIHDNEVAAKSADSINALAYTSENNIVFNSGQYNTSSEAGKRLLAHELTHVVQQSDSIQPYRDPASKNSIAFGENDTAGLVEDSFNIKTDKETKPWIKLITIDFTSQAKDKPHFWKGTGVAEYYDNKVKLLNLDLNISGGSPEVGKTKSGTFTVTRIEGVGYNSSAYSDPYTRYSKKGWGRRYGTTEDEVTKKIYLNGNMNYAVFFYGGQALHVGPVFASSHGCVHVDWDNQEIMRQLNYHSVVGLTKVKINYK